MFAILFHSILSCVITWRAMLLTLLVLLLLSLIVPVPVSCCYIITATTSVLFWLDWRDRYSYVCSWPIGQEKREKWNTISRAIVTELTSALLSLNIFTLSLSLSGGVRASTRRDRCTPQSAGEGRGKGIFHLYGTQRQRARASHTRWVSEWVREGVWCSVGSIEFTSWRHACKADLIMTW